MSRIASDSVVVLGNVGQNVSTSFDRKTVAVIYFMFLAIYWLVLTLNIWSGRIINIPLVHLIGKVAHFHLL